MDCFNSCMRSPYSLEDRLEKMLCPWEKHTARKSVITHIWEDFLKILFFLCPFSLDKQINKLNRVKGSQTYAWAKCLPICKSAPPWLCGCQHIESLTWKGFLSVTSADVGVDMPLSGVCMHTCLRICVCVRTLQSKRTPPEGVRWTIRRSEKKLLRSKYHFSLQHSPIITYLSPSCIIYSIPT